MDQVAQHQVMTWDGTAGLLKGVYRLILFLPNLIYTPSFPISLVPYQPFNNQFTQHGRRQG